MDKFDTNAGGDAVDVDAGDAAGFSLLAFLKAIKSDDMSSRPACLEKNVMNKSSL